MATCARAYHRHDIRDRIMIDPRAIVATSRFGFAARGNDLAAASGDPRGWVLAQLDRPAAPLAPVLPHPVEFSGETSEARRKRIAEIVKSKGADACRGIAPAVYLSFLNLEVGQPEPTSSRGFE